MTKEREIIFFKSQKVKEKIGYVFRIIKTVENVPEKFLKHLENTDALFEIRIEVEGNICRIFCCFDKGNIVVLFNAFQKKSQKTPKQEIDLGKKLKMNTSNQKNKSGKKQAILNTKNFDQLLDVEYGKIGTKKRDAFEAKAQYFVISEMLKAGKPYTATACR